MVIPLASRATKQIARKTPSLTGVAAKCGVCFAALLGIVVRLRPSSRVSHPSAFCHNAIRVGLNQRFLSSNQQVDEFVHRHMLQLREVIAYFQ